MFVPLQEDQSLCGGQRLFFFCHVYQIKGKRGSVVHDFTTFKKVLQQDVVMRKCLSVQASNEETKEHLYETLMAECRDTIQAVREELKSEAVRPDGEPSSVVENPGFTPSFLPIRNSVRGALTLKAERCPTCSTCTGEWF